MIETTIKIEGMSCQHCVARVKKTIDGLNGVSESEVQVGIANVKFEESKIKKEDIEAAIEKAGYRIKNG